MEQNSYIPAGGASSINTGQLTYDPTSILKLADTRDIIEYIFFDICGLKKIQKGDNFYIVRITKPKATYEFANDLQTLLFVQSNKITSRTDYSNIRLGNFFMLKSDTLNDFFSIHGFKSFITANAWKKIKELALPDTNAKPVKIDSNNKRYYPNFWSTLYGIEWGYDLPVNQDMLDIVKKEYDLENEEAGQAAELRELFWSIMIFLEGSLNKSKDHLSLDHEKSTISERSHTNYVAGSPQSEHKKNGLFKNIFGG